MVSLFKEKSATSIFWLIVISILLRAHYLITPARIATLPEDGLLFYVLNPLASLPAVAIGILYHAIIVVQSLRINYAINNMRMLHSANYTTALGYILLTALLPEWNNLSTALVANTFLILFIYRLPALYNSTKAKTAIFNTGLIAGSGILLYYGTAPLLLAAFIALGILRPFKIDEWIVLLLGIITPVYFFCSYLFLTDNLHEIKNIISLFQPHLFKIKSYLTISISFGPLLLAIIAGIFQWQKNASRMVIQVRKNWSILFITMLLFAPAALFIGNLWPNALLCAAVPGAAFVANQFTYPRNSFLSAFFFWLLAAVVICNNWHLYNQ